MEKQGFNTKKVRLKLPAEEEIRVEGERFNTKKVRLKRYHSPG